MTVRALRSTAHRILERCDRATVESLRITEAGHQAGRLPTPRQGIGPAFLPGERGRHQVLEGRAGEQVVQAPSSHSRSRASRWTGIAEPANASSAVSIARPGSEAKTAATHRCGVVGRARSSQCPALLGQLSVQPAGGHARLVVGRGRVGFEDDRDGHRHLHNRDALTAGGWAVAPAAPRGRRKQRPPMLVGCRRHRVERSPAPGRPGSARPALLDVRA